MAKLPRRRTRRLAAVLAAAAAVTAPAAAGEAVDLIGAWHVLIHYTDDHSHDPKLMRWDDRVWVFERSGSRLRWTEYPIVVFEDQTGRFEPRGAIRSARVLHGWEPNPAQLAQIEAGPAVNNRGSKTKTLRKHGDDGWRSATRPTAASASIVTYVETWIIEDASGKPIFRREDSLASGISEEYDGVTEYATTEVAAGGDVLRGRFERDGTRHGTFRLKRSGAPQALKGKGRSEGQRFYEAFLGKEFGAAIRRSTGALRKAVEQRKEAGGEVPEELREQARAEVRAALEARIRDAGRDPDELRPEVESLARQIEAQLVERGRSFDEVERMLRDGQLNP